MANTNLTVERLKELLHYDPETGVFTWLVNRKGRFARTGKTAGHLEPASGYIQIGVDGKIYRAHRLAWFYIHGCWPVADIDHAHGNKSDTRLEKLREATRGENMQNQRKARCDNKSCGLLGVTWDQERGKWMAKIQLRGKNHFIGRFDEAQEAHAAYLAAKREHHPFCTI